MLHLVTQAILEQLVDCPNEPDDVSRRNTTTRRAIRILLEKIIYQLPEPRAYLVEPSHRPDKSRDTEIWDVGTDLLTAYLNDRKVSVIDPASLRALFVFCPAFHELLDATDPMWLTFVATGAIQQVYIPQDGMGNKRHEQARRRAKARGIQVHEWHLANSPQSRPSHP